MSSAIKSLVLKLFYDCLVKADGFTEISEVMHECIIHYCIVFLKENKFLHFDEPHQTSSLNSKVQNDVYKRLFIEY